MRASDQDRHEAVLALSDHLADGRLGVEEFTTRMERAQEATYLHELDPLFVDLPARRKAAPPAPVRRPRPWLLVPILLVIALAVTTGHPWALFWLIPLGFFLKHRALHRRYPVYAHPRLPR